LAHLRTTKLFSAYTGCSEDGSAPPTPRAPPPAAPVVSSDGEGTPVGKLDHAISELQALPPLDNPGTSKLLEALEDVQPTNVGRKMPDGSDPPPLPKLSNVELAARLEADHEEEERHQTAVHPGA